MFEAGVEDIVAVPLSTMMFAGVEVGVGQGSKIQIGTWNLGYTKP